MELDSRQTRKILQAKGVDFLYHANSLTTSCTFLQQGALLSRGTVQKRHLAQTSQNSDQLDKRFGIWNDVFLDMVDIHARAGQRNFYGPILFVFDLKLLSIPPVRSIWITKKNPINWEPREQRRKRFYVSVEEFRVSYNLGDFGAMLVFRDIDGVLPLKGKLRKIVIDDPDTQFDVKGKTISALNYAINAIRSAAKMSGLRNLKIECRSCNTWCGCHQDYWKDPFMTKKFFALNDKNVMLHLP